MGFLNRTPEELLFLIPAILIGLTIHEYAHAMTAYKLGDSTAYMMGRASLNPLRHIDPVGFLFLLLFGFGYAKPVMVDRSKLSKPVLYDNIIALAGPFSNFLTALFFIIWIRLSYLAVANNIISPGAGYFIFLNYFVAINIGLGVFNLIPIPPLDGSHPVLNAIPARHEKFARNYYYYGFYILLGIIFAERLFRIDILPIGTLMRLVNSGLTALASIIIPFRLS